MLEANLYCHPPHFPNEAVYHLEVLYPDDRAIVTVTELKRNAGMSITNNWERVATYLWKSGAVCVKNPAKIEWRERYEDMSATEVVYFDFDPDGRDTFTNPRWKRLQSNSTESEQNASQQQA